MLILMNQMQQAGSAFDGVSFHCYQGSVSEQAEFTSQYPNKVWWMPSDYDFVDVLSLGSVLHRVLGYPRLRLVE
jgi:hypothetical protein